MYLHYNTSVTCILVLLVLNTYSVLLLQKCSPCLDTVIDKDIGSQLFNNGARILLF